MTPEKEVQNKIIKYLKELRKKGYPCYVERRQAGGYSYRMGIADLYAVYNGIHIEIEVKAPGKLMGPMQEKWKKECEDLNIIHIVADNVEDVKNFFKKLIVDFK